MIQKHRISTDIGRDKKILVELNQNFDLLEILSLKFSQKDIYASVCSDYGVVCGRISVNDGFGVPNAKVSIFIPLSDEDSDDPVISELYPFKKVNDKNEEGYRYNLLPSRKQHGGHEPTGTFPDQLDIMTREEVLEVYEKYYKYTVKTNEAGDFMIWGVPVGEQVLHVDVDLSDVGCFSLRPYDFIKQGEGVDKFKNSYTFKASPDLDSLPQIKRFDKNIIVYPFWGNEDLCEIGITRTDFDLSEVGVKIEPKAYLIGGIYTDTGKNSVNKNCDVRRKMGRKCDLTTKTGKIEAIRFTTERDQNNRPILEVYQIDEDIPEDGGFVFPLPMNMEYVYTNEFGELEVTNDTNKGIPTAACYRFRFSMDDQGNERVRKTAKFLVPNIREYIGSQTAISYSFSTNWKEYPLQAVSADSDKGILYNVDGRYYPRDYFYRFSYNKVYTVSSFHSMFYEKSTFRNDRYLGIKEIVPAEEEDCTEYVTPPTNFGNMNVTFTLILAQFLLILENILLFITLIIQNSLSRLFFNLGRAVDTWPVREVGIAIKRFAYVFQEENQRTLALITYPECESCDEDNVNNTVPQNTTTYCEVGSVTVLGITPGGQHEEFFNGAISGTPINVIHNLGANPTIKVYVWDGSAYVQLVDYFYPNDPGTNNTFWISGRTNTTNFNLYMNYTTPINGYVRVEGTPSVTLATSGLDNTIPTCTNPSPYDTPTGFTMSNPTDYVDFLSKQNNYILQSSSGLIYELNSTGTRYFSTVGGFLVLFDENSTIQTTETFTILDKNTKYINSDATVEDGCDIYDTPYDETLISYYYTGVTRPTENTSTGNSMPAGKIVPSSYVGGTNVTATNLSNDDGVIRVTDGSNKCDCDLFYYKDKDNRSDIYPLASRFVGDDFDDYFVRKTPSGQSEFRDGIFYFVPGAQTNTRVIQIIKEYIRRKRVAKLFCGGIVNYSFVDNWLSGSLYFFQFKGKKNKVCDRIIYTKTLTTEEGDIFYEHYYRSTRYLNESNWGKIIASRRQLNNPTTIVDLGPRDEFIKEICVDKSLDPNCSVVRSIGPTSFQSFGEIMGMAINYRLDVSNGDFDYKQFFNNNGFSLSNQKILDGDIMQLISINNEAGIEEFDLQNPKYLGYSYQVLDPDDPAFSNVFKSSGVYGPLPITLYLDDDGERVRSCLNEGMHIDYYGNKVDGRLTEASQKVPFFLWDKKGTGFGPYNDNTHDDQSWDYTTVQVQPLQGMTYNWGYTGGDNDSSDKYLLLPITYNFSGMSINSGLPDTGFDFEFNDVSLSDTRSTFRKEYPGFTILHVSSGTVDNPLSGTMYTRVGPVGHNTSTPFNVVDGWASLPWDNSKDFIIRPTLDYYSGSNKQILSTPFMFYFGLRNGKTGVDKFIQLFGDKGAFTSAE